MMLTDLNLEYIGGKLLCSLVAGRAKEDLRAFCTVVFVFRLQNGRYAGIMRVYLEAEILTCYIAEGRVVDTLCDLVNPSETGLVFEEVF